ncbi:hypothetical protein [Marinospirillum sp.]|uniref:hypothetical protein n=1 Tax=Marinospirillum sp. TaxID=2183934 RepID=UPI00384C7C66
MATHQQLLELLQSKDPLQLQLASLLETSDSDWLQIFEKHPKLAFILAQNPRLPASLVDELARHPSPRVRYMIACHGNLSFEAMQYLLEDEEAAIRLALAKRDDLDQQFTSQLLEDTDPGVRLALDRYQPPVRSLPMACGW